jgi:hypothetical protein
MTKARNTASLVSILQYGINYKDSCLCSLLLVVVVVCFRVFVLSCFRVIQLNMQCMAATHGKFIAE